MKKLENLILSAAFQKAVEQAVRAAVAEANAANLPKAFVRDNSQAQDLEQENASNGVLARLDLPSSDAPSS